MDSLWQQNQFSIPSPATVPHPNWQQQNEIPSSMWEIQQNTNNIPTVIPVSTIESQLSKAQDQEQKAHQQQPISQQKPKLEKDKELDKEKSKDELSNSEKKRKKEQEEKQIKKEAEEKRKQEQRKQVI